MGCKVNLKQGTRYQATVTLKGIQTLGTNAQVADELKKAGFDFVSVQGSGAVRLATGRWPKPDIEAELPPQLSEIKIIN